MTAFGDKQPARIDHPFGKPSTGADLIQQLPGAVLLRGLVPHLDQGGFRVHNVGFVGAAPQTDLPIKTAV